MATKVFVGDIYSTATRFGKEIYAKSSENIEPGLLVTITTGSVVAKGGTGGYPDGVAYGGRYQVYRPTSKVFADGEEMSVLMGEVFCLYSADFFTSGSLPSADETLYSGANGKMALSGSYAVGKCIELTSRIEEVGGVGTSQNLAVVHLFFNPVN